MQTSLISGLLNRKLEKKPGTAKKTLAFGRLLETAQKAEDLSALADIPFSELAATELLDSVHVSGDALKKDASKDNIKAYKKAVRDFIHYVVESVYETREQSSGRNILKRKKFTTITVIDEKLERFAADIMSGQRDKLDILGRLEEIHGLLVDLLR